MLLELTEDAFELSQALLTWNCKHMANAQIQRKLAQISSDLGYILPVISTPYELIGYNLEV